MVVKQRYSLQDCPIRIQHAPAVGLDFVVRARNMHHPSNSHARNLNLNLSSTMTTCYRVNSCDLGIGLCAAQNQYI